MEKTPTQYLHRSGWGERIALLLLSLVLVAFPVYRMYIEKELTFKYILLLVLALLVIAFLCRSFKVDEFGITVYWFALFPQLIPWKSIRRIEYCNCRNTNALIVESGNIPPVSNPFSQNKVSWYLAQHMISAICIPASGKNELLFSVIARYCAIGGMIDLPVGEQFDPKKHTKNKRGIW